MEEVKTVTPEVKQEEPKQEDLVTRASEVKLYQKEKGTPTLTEAAPQFKTVDDAIKWAENKEKEWSSGYGKKFHELAELRKSLEKKAENVPWTPERIQSELLKDPTFIDAAQKVAGIQSESMLSEDDKRRIDEANRNALIAQHEALKQQRMLEDERLKSKYKNYNPEAVDIVTQDLLEGKEKASREHLWKVLDYESAIQRAYELGKSDKVRDVTEKISAVSPTGYTAVSNESIKPEQGESSMAYWNRVTLHNLAKASKETIRK